MRRRKQKISINILLHLYHLIFINQLTDFHFMIIRLFFYFYYTFENVQTNYFYIENMYYFCVNFFLL